LLKTLGSADILEASRISKNQFVFPHKYHATTVILALTQKTAEKKARISIARQTLDLIKPKNAYSFITQVLGHAQRKTY
jgi:hypothetical protein